MREIRSFDDAARVVYRGGHGASKSSRVLKTVVYSPRKRPEMLEIMSFDDVPTGGQNLLKLARKAAY